LKSVTAVALIASNQPPWQSISAAAFELQQERHEQTCLGCDLFLRSLQNSRHDQAVGGQPLKFLHSGSHQRAYNSWKLPTFPSNTTASPEEKTLFGRRMQLVAGDVTRELGDKTRKLVEERFGHRN
jgi:hypothetical protein